MAKILLVDDDQQTLDFVKCALKEEHEVFAVDNWTKINEYLFKQPIDLILLDVNLPGTFQGDKIADLLLKLTTQNPIHIVLFSAMNESALRAKARAVGVDGYISKVFDKDLLRVRVRRFLQQK